MYSLPTSLEEKETNRRVTVVSYYFISRPFKTPPLLLPDTLRPTEFSFGVLLLLFFFRVCGNLSSNGKDLFVTCSYSKRRDGESREVDGVQVPSTNYIIWKDLSSWVPLHPQTLSSKGGVIFICRCFVRHITPSSCDQTKYDKIYGSVFTRFDGSKDSILLTLRIKTLVYPTLRVETVKYRYSGTRLVKKKDCSKSRCLTFITIIWVYIYLLIYSISCWVVSQPWVDKNRNIYTYI